MYEYLEGSVVAHPPGRVVLDVGGVGYDLAVPIGAAPPSGRARLWTHLVVREDAHLLYGFAEREAREVFRMLLSVRRVGPTVALALLSSCTHAELIEAIASGEVERLVRTRGVGRKLAEQIVLDLQERAVALRMATAAGVARRTDGKSPPLVEDAVRALLSIGFAEKEARAAVERARVAVGAAELEPLVRAALRG